MSNAEALPDPYAERLTLAVPMSVREAVALRELAAAQRMTAENYLGWIVQNLVSAEVRNDQVVRLWAQGYRDRQIAATLGMTNAQVADRRRRAGLPANRFPR